MRLKLRIIIVLIISTFLSASIGVAMFFALLNQRSATDKLFVVLQLHEYLYQRAILKNEYSYVLNERAYSQMSLMNKKVEDQISQIEKFADPNTKIILDRISADNKQLVTLYGKLEALMKSDNAEKSAEIQDYELQLRDDESVRQKEITAHAKSLEVRFSEQNFNLKQKVDYVIAFSVIALYANILFVVVWFRGTLIEVDKRKSESEAILLGIGEGLVVVDVQGRIVMVNNVFESLLGWKKEEVIGRLFTEVVPIVDINGREIPTEEMVITRTIKEFNEKNNNLDQEQTKKLTDTYFIRKDKTKFPVQGAISPILVQGKINGAVEVFYDVTNEKQIDKMKTEFISLASHQLRTPLSTINWYTEILLSGENGEITQEQKQFLDEIYSASKRMVALVNSLLNVSRIELGTMIIEPVMTDLVKLLKTEISNNALQIKNKNIQVVENNVIEGLELPLDAKLMQMVLQNILTNSIKYSPENTKIEISVNKTDNEVTISIADHGIGIPKSDQPKIFLKLFRAKNAREEISDGNGLGLYLAKMIMDQSGGKIWFESEEGKGTTFYIELPISGMTKKDGTKDLS